MAPDIIQHLLCCSLWYLIVIYLSLLLTTRPTTAVSVKHDSARTIRERQDTACADIFNSEFILFPASEALDCLTSVPFNSTVALQFLKYYKDTLQFQSTLAYLKNPPESYQQPAVDILGGLDEIKDNVDDGNYKNEYEFELAVQRLLYSAHDAHLTLFAGALAVFSFGSPLRIVSVSEDGISLPKIYVTDDILESQSEAGSYWNPSPITKINGVEATQFLAQFAAKNAQGTLDADADYNQLMSSAAGDIQGILSVFEGSTPFYPGDSITFDFQNGTDLELPWLATYTVSDTQPAIESGEDFYSWFVLGEYPSGAATGDIVTTASRTAAASSLFSEFSTATADVAETITSTPEATSDESLAASNTAPSIPPTPSSWEYDPYPDNPVVSQPDLGLLNGGVVTGYFLNDGVTAVLSIPSFDVTGEAVRTFSSTVGRFIKNSKAAGYSRIIIDVQKNGGGGGDLLATDTFRQFFPHIDPFGGSRLRAHPMADALGTTFTTFYTTNTTNETFYEALSANVWTATGYLGADTGRNFSSWAEYFGPHPHNGDLFTTTQRDNLSSVIFSESAGGIVVYGFGNRTVTSPQPFAAENIVVLSDSWCHSACAEFVEMMHHQGGARTVVVGGLPKTGSMQIPSGSRGSLAYSTDDLDIDTYVAGLLNDTVRQTLPDRDDLDFYISYAGFNLKDAVREGEDVPLQFVSVAADCRIFYTPRTVYNYLNLWNYVVDALWRNPSLCVKGSTNQLSASNVTVVTSSDDPTPVITGASVADMIMQGFSTGNPGMKKRNAPPYRTLDVDSMALSAPRINPRHEDSPIRKRMAAKLAARRAPLNSPKLSTFATNALVNPDGECVRCDKPLICASIQSCSRGLLSSFNDCRRQCFGYKNECGSPSLFYCKFTSRTSGFCDSLKNAKALDSCQQGTPTGGSGPQVTRAVLSPKINKMPYGPESYGRGGKKSGRGGGRFGF